MTLQISRRGREYLKTAQTLLHAAKTMTDRAVADQLKFLASEYERRAEKAWRVDAAKALIRSSTSGRGPQSTTPGMREALCITAKWRPMAEMGHHRLLLPQLVTSGSAPAPDKN